MPHSTWSWLQRHRGTLALFTLVLGGLALATWHTPDLKLLLEKGDRIADQPAAMVAIVALMIVMFTFALPGSLGLWLIAPFHPPVVSVAMLLVGSVLGALGAHTVSHRLGRHRSPGPRADRLVEFLRDRSDLPTQTALRMLPGFPHSFINYAGGVLGLPRGSFLLAASLGLGVKWGVYATAVHGAVEAVETGDALHPGAILPLFILAAMLVVGGFVRKRIDTRRDRG